MNTKRAVVLCTIFFLFASIKGAVFKELNGNFSSPVLIMDDMHYCIWDVNACRIHVFTIKTGEKIGEFGREGEGPSDLKVGLGTISLHNQLIFVNQYPKLSIFSKTGELRRIIKCSNAGSIVPFGQNYLGTQYISIPKTNRSKKIFSLFDSNLEKKKDIFQGTIQNNSWPGNNKLNACMVNICLKAIAVEDKIFVGSSVNGFLFLVYDSNVNKQYEIKYKYERRTVTNKYKEWRLKTAEKAFGRRWQIFKHRFNFVFPEDIPAFINFTVNGGILYVFLHPIDDTGQEVLCFDLVGKFLHKVKIPLLNFEGIMDKEPIQIHNEKMYYLIDNPDTEKWEIHFQDLSKQSL